MDASNYFLNRGSVTRFTFRTPTKINRVNKIGDFYKQAQKSHVRIAVHYDLGKINTCKKKASQILSSIRNAQQIIRGEDSIETLIRLSRDPMQEIKEFVDLLNMANADIAIADDEVTQRMSNKGPDMEEETDNQFQAENNKLVACRTILEEVKKDHVNG